MCWVGHKTIFTDTLAVYAFIFSGSWSDFITWTTLKIHDWLLQSFLHDGFLNVFLQNGCRKWVEKERSKLVISCLYIGMAVINKALCEPIGTMSFRRPGWLCKMLVLQLKIAHYQPWNLWQMGAGRGLYIICMHSSVFSLHCNWANRRLVFSMAAVCVSICLSLSSVGS